MTALSTTTAAAPYQAPPATLQHLEVIKSNFGIIQAAMNSVLKNKVHYGVIPGTGQSKPVLLKPGADVLCSLFHFATKYETSQHELPNEHREYIVSCLLCDTAGNRLGEGLGLCSTMEKKYRYRPGAGEVTDIPVPKNYWDMQSTKPAEAANILVETANKAGHPGRKFGVKKHPETGRWCISTFGERAENDCIADVYNTCLKMAAKRALVSAVLTVTGASAVFSQDLEDMTGDIIEGEFEEIPDPEPEPDPEALFDELALKSGLSRKKEKDDLRKFINLTAQGQGGDFADTAAKALKHFDSFRAAFANWLQKNQAPKKTEPEPAADIEAEPAPSEGEEAATLTPATLQAIEKELTRLGVPGHLPPDIAAEYETGDPSELTEGQGRQTLIYLKNMKG